MAIKTVVKATPKPETGFLGALSGLKSLLVGLGITGRAFVDKQVTVHYPRETVENEALEGYRGHIELVGLDDNPAESRCIMCMKCMRTCPSGCISIKSKLHKHITPENRVKEVEHHGDSLTPVLLRPVPHPKKGRKELTKFNVDFSLCSLCGICVQLCPAHALRHSQRIYWSEFDRKDFDIDLIERLKRQAEEK